MNRGNILIVEDDPDIALGIRESLEELGYPVAGTTETGEQAILIARQLAPDLILMDINLGGGMDGVVAADQIRHESAVPVVFLTSYADEATLKRAMDVSPFGYVRKPFQDMDLHIAITMALLRSRLEKKLNAALEEVDRQRGFFEALFDANPNGILVVNTERRVHAANQAVERMLGIGAGQLTGKRIGDVLHCTRTNDGTPCGENPDCVDCRLMAAVTTALAGSRAYRNRTRLEWRAAGKRQHSEFLVSSRSVDYLQQKLAVVIIEDITELSALRRQEPRDSTFAGMVGRHQKMREVFEAVRDVAEANVPVLVLGESGTGKELVARAIHENSRRADKPFVPVNCGALPEGLLESELFGHVRGAFTGAIRDKKGRFELADGGTIFLDEIGDLTPAVQVKLLRVLQEGTFERVGSENTLRVDVRVISATHKNLQAEMTAGKFREDLFYRLSVVPITLPPLRERGDDVRLLAEAFLNSYKDRPGGSTHTLEPDALKLLRDQSWPGNVRELQNALQYAVIKSHGPAIGAMHLPPSLTARSITNLDPGNAPLDIRKVRRLTRELVEEALRETGGNRVQAARRLGVSRATLYRFLSDSGG